MWNNKNLNIEFEIICWPIHYIYIYIYIDVPMGGYDSSQIADLVGLYILHVLNRIINSDHVGL